MFAEAVAALLPMVDMGTDESLNDALAEKVTPRLGALLGNTGACSESGAVEGVPWPSTV